MYLPALANVQSRKLQHFPFAFCSQASQGANCTPGTDLNLGVEVVNKYAQDRFHKAAQVSLAKVISPSPDLRKLLPRQH